MIDANKDKRNEINEKLRDIIVDLADLWDGPESSRYGERLYNVLKELGINDYPKFYKKENMDKIIKELNEKKWDESEHRTDADREV